MNDVVRTVLSYLFFRKFLLSLFFIFSVHVSANAELFTVNGTQLISQLGDQFNYTKPKWNSDATYLSFEKYSPRERLLFTYETAKGYASEVKSTLGSSGSPNLMPGGFMNTSRSVANFDMTWSKTQKSHFTFIGSGDQGNFGMYHQQGGGASETLELIVGGEPGGPYVAHPDYHPLVDYLVFCLGERGVSNKEDEARLDLYAVEQTKKGYQTKVESTLLQGIPQIEPTFAPDGNMVAFTGVKNGNNDIYIIDVAINPRSSRPVRWKQVKRLTSMPTPEGHPQFSPDGQQIAFISGYGQEKKEWGLWVMNSDGTNQRKLVDRVYEEDAPEWHPNGTHIFFVRQLEAQNNPIQYVSVNTGEIQTLETGTSLHTHLSISQSGDKIAYTAKGKKSDKDLTWLKLYTAFLNTSSAR
jgi:Tol biopolymer transport system component